MLFAKGIRVHDERVGGDHPLYLSGRAEEGSIYSSFQFDSFQVCKEKASYLCLSPWLGNDILYMTTELVYVRIGESQALMGSGSIQNVPGEPP